MGSTTTNSDGTFSLKTPAAYSENYTLQIIDNNSPTYGHLISLRDNHDIDLGDILMGTHPFYCKVTINPVDGSAIDFFYISNVQTHFNAGTSTQFVAYQNYDYSAYHHNNSSFPIGYKTYPGGVAKDTVILVPATTPDTLNVTINY